MIVEAINLEGLQRMLVIVFILWFMVFVAVCCDMWTGIKKAKALHEEVDSQGMRRTFSKASDYWSVMSMLLLLDFIGNIFPWYNFPYTSILGTVGVIYIELKSMFENLKAKRSAAADIPDAIRQIIQCKDVAKAAELLQAIKGIADAGEGKNTPTVSDSLGNGWQEHYTPIQN